MEWYYESIFGNYFVPPWLQDSGEQIGQAQCHAHHGEILQGMFEDKGGGVVRGLITLPRYDMWSQAKFCMSNATEIKVIPQDRLKAKKAAELTLAYLGEDVGGTLTLSSNIDKELGLGSSSSDVVAAIKAVGRALGVELPLEVIGKLSVSAETASDSLMYDQQTVLFAQREGRVLEHLGAPLPKFVVITSNTGSGINTCAFPPADYSHSEIQEFKPLLGLLRYAIKSQSHSLVGKVATQSAIINQRYLPKPYFKSWLFLVDDLEACGVQVAHSGSLIGLMFNPSDPAIKEKITSARRYIEKLGYLTSVLITG